MITLYGMGSPNVVKVVIALEELGLSYDFRLVDVFKAEQFEPSFLALNPNPKVPVLVDREGPGGRPITIFESGAILFYLAEKTGKLIPKDGAARYQALQWLMVQLTSQGPMSGQLVHFVRFAPPGNDYSLARYRTQVRAIYQAFEQRLAQTRYLGGPDFGLVDIAAFPWARVADTLNFLGEAKPQHPNLLRWLGEVATRPAVVRALAKADEVRARTTPFDKANPDQLDRFLGRGRYTAA